MSQDRPFQDRTNRSPSTLPIAKRVSKGADTKRHARTRAEDPHQPRLHRACLSSATVDSQTDSAPATFASHDGPSKTLPLILSLALMLAMLLCAVLLAALLLDLDHQWPSPPPGTPLPIEQPCHASDALEYEAVLALMPPPCRWSWKQFRCGPGLCRLGWHWGLLPRPMCRLQL